ncbi:hypothetical protein BGAL_0029g00120 [Botrytis galanthina]|uniref:Uncharacterized protein n=1 Tax=Botrytis galanthina TaxID=278940 RepID=A0A4S8R8L1_9HELO|nr:hypothetical protein BGAL_0029g00120 [Botrytis galanthina]
MDVVNAFSMKSQLKPETRYRRVFGASPPQIERSGRLRILISSFASSEAFRGIVKSEGLDFFSFRGAFPDFGLSFKGPYAH